MSNTLASGASLAVGEGIVSPNGRYRLELLSQDGNFVLSGPGGAVWSSESWNKGAVRVDMQADGNLVMYKADNSVVWASNSDSPGAHLVVQDDRNVVTYARDGSTVAWTPNTYLTDAEKSEQAQADADAAPAAEAAPPVPAAAPAPAAQTYTVVGGDTLSAIAKRFYGHANEYHKIAAANGIANPDLIHPGQVLTIP